MWRNLEKLVSIVIPAYNAHSTIQKTFRSITLQTIAHLALVIIIDDCSTDNYEYLKHDFPELDIEIYKMEENSGPGYARNLGIEKTIEFEIPYMIFVDADDYLYSCMSLQELVETIITKDKEYDWGSSVFLEHKYDKTNNNSLYVPVKDFDVWLFGKIYKTKIIEKHKIRFPKLAQNEDAAFNMYYRACCDTINFTEKVTYVWGWNDFSITRRDTCSYSSYNHLGLCRNTIDIFHQILIDPDINKELLIYVIINRLLKFYVVYNTIQDHEQEFIILLKEFYQLVVKPYKDYFSQQLFEQEWQALNIPILPIVGLEEFIKIISEE